MKSIKSECLEKMIFFGEKSLLRAATTYLEHYHHERNHQGLENKLIDPSEEVGHSAGVIKCRERLGACSITTIETRRSLCKRIVQGEWAARCV